MKPAQHQLSPQLRPDSVAGYINPDLEHCTFNGFVEKFSKHQGFLYVWFFFFFCFLVVFTEDIAWGDLAGGCGEEGGWQNWVGVGILHYVTKHLEKVSHEIIYVLWTSFLALPPPSVCGSYFLFLTSPSLDALCSLDFPRGLAAPLPSVALAMRLSSSSAPWLASHLPRDLGASDHISLASAL